MKSIFYTLFILTFGLLFSCTSSRDMVYFQNNKESDSHLPANLPNPVMPMHIIANGDLLSLTISTPLQTSSQITNQIENKSGFLVKSDSTIDLPLFGKIKLGGLTLIDAKDSLLRRAKYYFTDPFVNLQLVSFKVMVFGEVKIPGIKVFNVENANLLDAISQSGDLTDYGDRSNIKLIRSDSVYYLNLRDIKIMKSQGFYLQSNDIIYVQPVKRKFFITNVSTSLTFISFATTIFSLTSTIILLTKK